MVMELAEEAIVRTAITAIADRIVAGGSVDNEEALHL